MARLFVKASAQYGAPSSLPVLTSAISISYWYRHATAPGAFPNRFTLVNRGANTNVNINYSLQHDAAGINLSYTTSSSTYVTFNGAVTFDTGVWHPAVLSSDFTTAGTQIYLDGSSLVVTPSGTPGTPETGADANGVFIARANSVNNEYFDGRLADIAIWSVQLTAGEAVALSRGRRPHEIRPQARFYPLDGLASPEPDLSGNAANATLTGSSVFAAGPPTDMFTPRWPQVAVTAAAASSVVFRRSFTGYRAGSRQAQVN
jgi:Concanavalin A-like lectin/glucanases superfamily